MVDSGGNVHDAAKSAYLHRKGAPCRSRAVSELTGVIAPPVPGGAVILKRNHMIVARSYGNNIIEPGHLDRSIAALRRPVPYLT